MTTRTVDFKDRQRLFEHLEELLSSQGIKASESQCNLLLDHLALVLHKNKVMNLTRITSPEDALVLHCLDSLLMLNELEQTRGPVLDLGTGAGYPGIPLAVMTGRPFTLMDSVGKKVRAVDEFVSTMGLEGVEGVHDRVEHFALDHRDQFGAVVARAVAPLGVLIEYAQPLLCQGGRLVVSKGRLGDEELDGGQHTASLVAMELVSRETIELPDDKGHREILAYEKRGRSSVPLPRPVGDAKAKPLV